MIIAIKKIISTTIINIIIILLRMLKTFTTLFIRMIGATRRDITQDQFQPFLMPLDQLHPALSDRNAALVIELLHESREELLLVAEIAVRLIRLGDALICESRRLLRVDVEGDHGMIDLLLAGVDFSLARSAVREERALEIELVLGVGLGLVVGALFVGRERKAAIDARDLLVGAGLDLTKGLFQTLAKDLAQLGQALRRLVVVLHQLSDFPELGRQGLLHFAIHLEDAALVVALPALFVLAVHLGDFAGQLREPLGVVELGDRRHLFEVAEEGDEV